MSYGYISTNIAIADVASQVSDKTEFTILLNEIGRIRFGDQKMLIDADEIDSEGEEIIMRLYGELLEIRKKQ